MRRFIAAALLLGACDYIKVYDREIKTATRALERAQNDTERATALTARGGGYSEKARLSFLRKIIGPEDYRQLFDLSIADHDQAITLDAKNAELYFNRGRSYYSRAAQIELAPAEAKPWFQSARADFAKAAALDPKHYMAFDYLGLTDEGMERYDLAIVDYEHEMALNPAGRWRLADVYCTRGNAYLKEKKLDPAAADFEKSIELGGNSDACSCEPYNPLAYIYVDEKKDYAKARELVRKTKLTRHRIAREYLERLEKAGR